VRVEKGLRAADSVSVSQSSGSRNVTQAVAGGPAVARPAQGVSVPRTRPASYTRPTPLARSQVSMNRHSVWDSCFTLKCGMRISFFFCCFHRGPDVSSNYVQEGRVPVVSQRSHASLSCIHLLCQE
jgi:hypothetical protein